MPISSAPSDVHFPESSSSVCPFHLHLFTGCLHNKNRPLGPLIFGTILSSARVSTSPASPYRCRQLYNIYVPATYLVDVRHLMLTTPANIPLTPETYITTSQLYAAILLHRVQTTSTLTPVPQLYLTNAAACADHRSFIATY